jgi:hypothetical protein
METKSQGRPKSSVPSEEEAYDESVQPEIEPEEYQAEIEPDEQEKVDSQFNGDENKGRFTNGLAVGLGIGCITTFIIMWVSVFFTPQISSFVTYDTLLSIFIYPLIYLFAVGLIALTAGLVKEYYSRR